MSAKDKQVGGSHYKNFAIQPVDFIEKNNLSFLEGCVIKRICRWRAKNGIEDLQKAIHEIELLIEQSNADWARLMTRVAEDDNFNENDEADEVPALNRSLKQVRTGPKPCPAWLKTLPNGTPVAMAVPQTLTGQRGRPRKFWVEVGFAWDGQLVPVRRPG